MMLSFSLTPPEFVAAWADVNGSLSGVEFSETLLGVTRFLASEEYIDLGRLLLKERLRRLDSESISVAIGFAVEVIAHASIAVTVYRAGVGR